MIKQKLLIVLFFTIILTSAYAQEPINNFDESGQRHGLWQKNYPETNQLRYQGQFVHGKEVDTFRYYKLKNRKSVLSAVKIFNNQNNEADVTFTASNGSIISKGKMDGKNFKGKWIFYHKNSDKPMTIENYNSFGELEGKRSVLFVNGKIAEEANYKNGKLNGFSKIYSESGKLLQESFYVEDKLDGPTVYYDTYGNIKAKGSFKANLKIGIWSYFESGILQRKVDHDSDKVIFKKQ